MFLNIEPMYLIGILVSFAVGALSYIIIQFWMRPISRYRKLKTAVGAHLDFYSEKAGELSAKTPETDAAAAQSRKYAVGLSDAYSSDLPPWYRMVLNERNESPADASAHLMKLANTREEKYIRVRLTEIRSALGLPA
ncbi:hypothetical protein DENIS_3845 [Desulfonema ishimotonii]|uniref:Uncharacterized protein n=1 Tax=Desulfonema ishimotonii TaxID=45657 RepID=A0A401G0W9_9BACT|nr:hypothetical protein [Desulfonema ishimotonii]GBC62861.1 hypothetical protein DENIS_3845 [Desulfonema ishimotonii]